MPANNLTIKINGDTADFQKKLSETEKATKNLQQSLSNIATKATVAFAGLSATIAGLIGTYRVQEQAESRLNAALMSTKNAAGLTSEELIKMAGGLQKVSTFGDETIIGAQSLLLTFTKIGKDVFPKAIETILDMSAAMGTDLKGSAIQVGKALNDPITGISALSRVGVQLSEDQKSLIKSFMSVNDVASAQKIILGELEVQFGGQAKATAEGTGRFIQLKNTLGDLAETIGKKLTKPLSEMADWLNKILVETLKKHGEEFANMASHVLLFSTNLAVLTASLALSTKAFFALKLAIAGTAISLKGLKIAVASTGVGLALMWAAEKMTEFLFNFKQNMKVLSEVWSIAWDFMKRTAGAVWDDLGEIQHQFFQTLYFLVTGSLKESGKALDLFMEAIANVNSGMVDDLVETHNKMQQAWKNYGKVVIPVTEARLETLQALSDARRRKELAEMIAFQELITEKLGENFASNLENQKMFDEMFDEYTAEQREKLLEDLSNFQITEKELDDQHRLDKLKAKIKEKNDELIFEKKHQLKLIGGMKTYYKTMKFLDDSRFKEAGKFASQFSAMASSSNKELRAIAKVGANVSIVANTVAAASSAMRGAIEFFGVPAGPIIGGVLAAAQIAFGVEQIHTLNAQKLADGGVVSGGIKGVDSVPAMLMPGELVIPQRDANDALNAIGASRDEEVFGNESTTQVIIGFDGEEASQVLTARQIENQALGISREEAA